MTKLSTVRVTNGQRKPRNHRKIKLIISLVSENQEESGNTNDKYKRQQKMTNIKDNRK